MDARDPSSRLPIGELQAGAGEAIRVRLLGQFASAERLRAWLFQAQRLDRRLFLVPEQLEEASGEPWLVYASETQAGRTFAEAMVEWRRSPSTRLPWLITLGRFLAQWARVQEMPDVGFLPLSPEQLVYFPGQVGGWRVLALPPANLSMADWAQADPRVWMWAAPELVLGRASSSRHYALGAALHVLLAGDLFPPLLPPRERFRRLLRGRVGLPQQLRGAIAAALPASFDNEGLVLERFILDLLIPEAGRRPAADEVERRFTELERALAPRRLAARWEHEGHPELALELLEQLALLAPEASVPWATVARLKMTGGDLPGALAAAARGFPGDEDAARMFRMLLRRLAESGNATRASLEEAIALLESSPHFSDETRLAIAHIEARYLDSEAALGHLQEPLADGWNEVRRAVLRARLLLEREEYEQVSRLSTDARARLVGMPGLPRAARYAEAYLLLLDGVANFGAVGRYKNPAFFGDAFQALSRSLECALSVGLDELRDVALRWLGWMGGFASQSPSPTISILHTVIQAYLSSRRLELPEGQELPPEVPWYDAEFLLPESDGGVSPHGKVLH
jgi:hypothetical protein